jgi:hypothetical protein
VTSSSFKVESNRYRRTYVATQNNWCHGFQSAFIDRETNRVYLLRFADGRLAPFHLLDGLPSDLVMARNGQRHVPGASPDAVLQAIRAASA